MAPTFVHGRTARTYVGRRSLYSILQQIDYDVSVEAPDVTTFGDNDRDYLAGGQRLADMSFEGIYDGGSTEAQKILEDALGSTSYLSVTIAPSLTTIGAFARLAQAIPEGFAVTAMTDDAVRCSAALKGTSRFDRGVMLMNEAARTSTAALSSVDNAAASTGGGVAHLHLVAQSTLTSYVVKVQHSSNASAWSDLITFTDSTAETVQRSTVAGTVKRYTRANISTFTGGAGKSVTAVVAFARRPIP